MELNEDQNKTLDEIIKFIAQPSKEDLIIDAPAGCGKDYLLGYLYKNIEEIYKRISVIFEPINKYTCCFTATTNEAVGNMVNNFDINTTVTIYKQAGIIPWNKSYKAVKPANVLPQIIIVNEASYVDKDLYYLLKTQIPNAKFIWVMDQDQLASGSSPEPFINIKNLPKGKEVSMNTIMRNQGNIQQASMELRKAVRNKAYVDLRKFANDTDIILLSKYDFQMKLIESLQEEEEYNLNQYRFLAYNRNVISHYNQNIASMVYNQPTFPYVGATAIVDKFNKHIGLHVGKTLKIHSVTPIVNSYPLLNGDIITVEELHVTTACGNLLRINNSPNVAKKTLRQLGIEQAQTELRLPFGCTVHKAQGQSIDTVFIDAENIEKCFDHEMKRRLKYVAFSRAKSKIYFTMGD